MPLLIGGATTSRVHTAVKIDPNYRRGQVVMSTTPAARSASPRRCCRREVATAYAAEIRAEYAKIADAHCRAQADKKRLSLDAARANAAQDRLGRQRRRRSRPSSAPGVSTTIDLAELRRLHRLDAVLPDLGTGGTLSRHPRRCQGRRGRAQRSIDDAQKMLTRSSPRNGSRRSAAIGFWPANARRRRHRALRRRERATCRSRRCTRCASSSRSAKGRPTSRCRISSRRGTGVPDYIGGFVVTAGHRRGRHRRALQARQ